MSYPGGQQYDPYSGQPVPPEYGQQPQQSAYRGLGAYDEPPPPRSRTPIVLAVVAALLLLGGAGVGVYFLTRDVDGSDSDALTPPTPQTSTTSSSAPPSSSTSSPSTSSTKRYTEVEPYVAGWQPVVGPREGAAFDVPDGWTIETPDTLAGFEDGNGRQVLMHSTATYREGECKEGSYRGGAGFMTAGEADPKEAPQVVAKMWATAAGELPEDSPKVTATAPKRVTIADGKYAWLSTATVKDPVKSECAPPSLKVIAVGFTPSSGGKTAMFVMHLDTDVDDELPAADAKKIIGSLRAVGQPS